MFLFQHYSCKICVVVIIKSNAPQLKIKRTVVDIGGAGVPAVVGTTQVQEGVEDGVEVIVGVGVFILVEVVLGVSVTQPGVVVGAVVVGAVVVGAVVVGAVVVGAVVVVTLGVVVSTGGCGTGAQGLVGMRFVGPFMASTIDFVKIKGVP